jgi:hypothetical protein
MRASESLTAITEQGTREPLLDRTQHRRHLHDYQGSAGNESPAATSRPSRPH